jgi:hypothetical protein
MPVEFNASTDRELLALHGAYMDKLGNFLRSSQPFWCSKLGIKSGTINNLEAGLAFITTLGNASLSSGCVSLQNETERALLGAGARGWTIEKVRVGSLVMGHSAVAVYPRGKSMSDGYVFDAWLKQAPLVFTFQEWENQFRAMSIMGGARRQ